MLKVGTLRLLARSGSAFLSSSFWLFKGPNLLWVPLKALVRFCWEHLVYLVFGKPDPLVKRGFSSETSDPGKGKRSAAVDRGFETKIAAEKRLASRVEKSVMAEEDNPMHDSLLDDARVLVSRRAIELKGKRREFVRVLGEETEEDQQEVDAEVQSALTTEIRAALETVLENEDIAVEDVATVVSNLTEAIEEIDPDVFAQDVELADDDDDLDDLDDDDDTFDLDVDEDDTEDEEEK
jgi:hypothetical protein